MDVQQSLLNVSLILLLIFSTDCLCNLVYQLLAYYLLYAKLEDQYGLARHAMAIYDRATKSVLPEEQFEVRHQLHDSHMIIT